jgi:tRNA/tmRNA/rRNA uracil-C5-methylase (TrmA/RlmC/RlmD family)
VAVPAALRKANGTIGTVDLDLAPTGMAAGGDAIARDADGRVVFVTGALPGERVRARVTASKKDFAKAVVVDVLSPSPDRVAPPCPALAAGGGGCGWQHVAVDAQRRLKRSIVVDALRRLGRVDADRAESVVDVDGVALAAAGYRTTVRLAVDPATGRVAYRQHGSHALVTPDDCLVLHPLLEARLGERFAGASEVTLRCGAHTGEVLVHPTPGRPSQPWFHEEAAGRRWRISAESFFQVRPDGADALADLVVDAAGSNVDTAVDLYAGVGLFAGVLSERLGARVVAVEGSAAAVDDAEVNLADIEGELVEADVTRWRPDPGSEWADVDVVVADPSRHGLGSRGADAVAACSPETVVLVSCDPAALGRDVRLLDERGYLLERATTVDLFPHTTHVEVVSRFVRQPRPNSA